MTCQQSTQTTRPTSNQDRTLSIKHKPTIISLIAPHRTLQRCFPLHHTPILLPNPNRTLRYRASEPRGAYHTLTQHQLCFTRSQSTTQRDTSGIVLINIDKHKPLRVLRLRGTHQTPHSRLRKTRQTLNRTNTNRTTSDQHQPRIRETLLQKPFLHQPKHPMNTTMHTIHETPNTTNRHTIHNHQPRNLTLTQRLTQRPQISMHHNPMPSLTQRPTKPRTLNTQHNHIHKRRRRRRCCCWLATLPNPNRTTNHHQHQHQQTAQQTTHARPTTQPTPPNHQTHQPPTKTPHHHHRHQTNTHATKKHHPQTTPHHQKKTANGPRPALRQYQSCRADPARSRAEPHQATLDATQRNRRAPTDRPVGIPRQICPRRASMLSATPGKRARTQNQCHPGRHRDHPPPWPVHPAEARTPPPVHSRALGPLSCDAAPHSSLAER